MTSSTLNSDWHVFCYLEPKKFGLCSIDISKYYGKEYRVKFSANIPTKVKEALYNYRYVHEFVSLLGYVYLIISKADQHFVSKELGTLHSELYTYSRDCDKYIPKTFDYDQLAKELWDDRCPELVSDSDLWQCYRQEQKSLMKRFKETVDCYVNWNDSWTKESLEALKTAFNNLLEVR